MAQVLDYSAGLPGALAIARAGYVGAVRYIGLPGWTKCTDRREFEDFSRNGIGMALVFEEAAGNWRGGTAQGRLDGRRARDHANAIGFPADRPIYMAIDQDVVSEFAVMVDYLRGASESLGGTYVTGVYGEADVIDRARDAKVASWFWQTKAWSRGRVTSAHLLQLIGTVYVGGIGCDINDVKTADWGQHLMRGSDMALADEKIKIWVEGQGWTYPAADAVLGDTHNYAKGADARTVRIEAKLDALAGSLSDDEANIIAAIRTGGVDINGLAAALAPILAPLVSTGATPDQVRSVTEQVIRSVFADAGQQEGN